MTARVWLRKELEANMDLYDNTPAEAFAHVLDLLDEGEYRDELTDLQVEKIRKEIKKNGHQIAVWLR